MKRWTLWLAAALVMFSNQIGAAVSVVKLVAGDPAPDASFGTSAAIDSGTLVIGAPGGNAAYVFARQGANLWSQEAKLTPSDGVGTFGPAVAIDGDTIVVGAPNTGNGTGAAYVFLRSSGTWSQQAKLVAGDASTGQKFGSAIDLHEDTAVIGTRPTFSGPGSAYVFLRSSGSWTEEQKLAPASPSDGFASSVAVHGDLALVGDPSQEVAHAFVRVAGAWNLDDTLTPTGGSGQNFGNAVALSGTTALIGARGEMQSAGAAYGFVRGPSDWQQQDRLVASDGAAGERFGVSVALDSDTAVIAALDQQTLGQSTQTFLYQFERGVDTWNETGKEIFDSGSLIGTGTEEAEFVGVSGCAAVAGTELDDSAATDAGAAYTVLLDECPCREPVSGLIGWWTLDELASPSFDVEGDHDADWIDDPTSVAGIVDTALEFDGHGDHLMVSHHPSLDVGADDSFTLDAWILPGDAAGVAGIVEKRDPVLGRGYSLRLEDGHPVFLLSDGPGPAASIVAPEPLPPGEWSFLGAAVDRAADQGLLYVNGEVVVSFVPSDLAPGDPSNDAPLRIAATAGDDFYQGALDEVEFFGRALSEAELDALFLALSGGKCKPCIQPPDDLAAWWPLDESIGPIAEDVAGPNEGEHVGSPAGVDGKVDGALEITAPGERVKVADHASLDFGATDSFTLDAWIRPDAVENRLSIIFQKWQPDDGVGYRLLLRSGRLVVQLGDGTVSQVSYLSPNQISTTAWTLVAVTVDRAADEGNVYINGALDSTSTPSFVPSDFAPGSLGNHFPLFIGGDLDENALLGRIDEVEIYRRALTASEIHTLYIAEDRGKCKPTALALSATPDGSDYAFCSRVAIK